MIFSKQLMETAFIKMSEYYNKVLVFDYLRDEYNIIKVDDVEWDEVPKDVAFSTWVKKFVESDKSKLAEELLILTNQKKLKELRHPLVIMYKKMVHGRFHDVQTELYPCNNGRILVFVRDLTKMEEE